MEYFLCNADAREGVGGVAAHGEHRRRRASRRRGWEKDEEEDEALRCVAESKADVPCIEKDWLTTVLIEFILTSQQNVHQAF